jgi:hypothetical protein
MAWIQRSHDLSISEPNRFAAGIHAGPTGLYHARQDVYLLTCATFERGDPAPSEVMICAGPREVIEDQASKLTAAARRGKPVDGLN